MVVGGVFEGGEEGAAGGVAAGEEGIVLELPVGAGVGGVVDPVVGSPAVAAGAGEGEVGVGACEGAVDAVDEGGDGVDVLLGVDGELDGGGGGGRVGGEGGGGEGEGEEGGEGEGGGEGEAHGGLQRGGV